MKSNMRSGAQGISGKNVKVGKMLSDHGSQTVTARDDADVGTMDNKGHNTRALPFSSMRIGELTIFKVGLAWLDSLAHIITTVLHKIMTFFKK